MKQLKKEQVLDKLNTASLWPDELTYHKGIFNYRQGFFYTHGQSADKIAEKIQAAIPEAKILETHDIWKPFRGGASLKSQSHFLVKFKVKEKQAGPKRLTMEEMKAKVVAWVEKIKADMKEIDDEVGLSDKFRANYDSLYVIQDVAEEEKRDDGAKEFLFLYDGELYEFIEHYRTDGFHKEYGQAFDSITEGTGWQQESERPGVEYFVEEI